MYRIAFIIEQTLGHVTHTQNLQHNIALDPTIDAYWGLIPWEATGVAAKLPIYKSNWTVRAGIRARSMIRHLARQGPPDALFIHTQVPAMFSTSWLKRIPSIVSLDATPRQYDRLGAAYMHQAGQEWVEHQKWRMHRNCFHAARRLVTWSQWAKDGLVNEYDVSPEKITIVPPGVNVQQWERLAPRSAQERSVRILFVGADLERKGGLLLIEAFRRLRPLGVELHLVTRSQVLEEPGLFLYRDIKPNSDALKSLYHQADIFCLPTQGDCLPMVLSEAGAAGLAAVSTAVGAIPEIIHHGETGFIVPTGDVDALTEALRVLVMNPQLRIEQGQRAITLVQKQFDAQRNARQLLALMKQTVDEAVAP